MINLILEMASLMPNMAWLKNFMYDSNSGR